MPLLGLAAWMGGLLALLPWPVGLGLAALAGLAVSLHRQRARARIGTRAGSGLTALACLLVASAVGGSALLRSEVTGGGPIADLASERAVVALTLEVTSDPVRRPGTFGDYVLVRARTTEVVGRGAVHRLGVPVLVLADLSWSGVPLGSAVRTVGRLQPAQGRDLAAVVSTNGDPEVVGEPGDLWRAAGAMRTAVRESVAHRPTEQRTLVPALVVGDDRGMPDEMTSEFRTTGLTHLLAVSGTNLTLVVGFLIVVARWCRVRGRWLLVVGLVGVAGFVLVARTEPSVVRAAAMGSVALIGMGTNGRQRGSRALGVAVVVLLLIDPWLATSLGFALSALATAGILFLAPGWRDALRRWLPLPVAEAIAIPSAAQLVCTPLVAAISGQVSLVAVAANLLVAPAVGPATVLGVLGGLAGLVWEPLGRVPGTVAAWCAGWIVVVADRGAALPTAAVGWGTGWVAITLLTLVCVALAVLAPRVLGRRWCGVGCALLMTVVVLAPVPTPGWPPRGWVLVACDVGQGDALVLNAGGGRVVVVDAGPDPDLVDRCLDRLDVRIVSLVVLTHHHADHVDGLGGVLEGRSVAEVVVTGDPSQPTTVGGDEALVPRVATYAESRALGDLRWQVLGPVPGSVPASGTGSEESSATNNASLVLLVEVRGVRMLLTGDIEPEAQASLADSLPGLRVDVLKVPHHGSRYQDLPFLTGLGARLAVVSSGADNGYGHPAPATLDALEEAGTTVARTDLAGDVAVVEDGGELGLASRH